MPPYWGYVVTCLQSAVFCHCDKINYFLFSKCTEHLKLEENDSLFMLIPTSYKIPDNTHVHLVHWNDVCIVKNLGH